jgi:hypothetical protein
LITGTWECLERTFTSQTKRACTRTMVGLRRP